MKKTLFGFYFLAVSLAFYLIALISVLPILGFPLFALKFSSSDNINHNIYYKMILPILDVLGSLLGTTLSTYIFFLPVLLVITIIQKKIIDGNKKFLFSFLSMLFYGCLFFSNVV